MEILYLISVLILLISFILIKKTENKIDIISFICLSIVLLFCYNTFICFVLTFFAILCKLWILMLINLGFSTILFINIIKKRQIQKYECNKVDIIYMTIITFVILLLICVFLKIPFNINYASSDPSYHYLTSIKFAKEDTLMPNAKHDLVYGDLSVRKPVSYVNSGLLMKCFCENYDPIECYNVFVGFGIFTLILIGNTIYLGLKKYANKKEHVFIAFIIALICTMGYPLNSFWFGFEYLTMGLLILCAIINMIYVYEKEEFKFSYILLMFGLLNFGLFFSYYMFIPFVYSALWIYFCSKNYEKTKKIITKKLIALIIITLLLPFIFGYIYHLLPKVYSIIINENTKNNLSYSQYVEFREYIVDKGFARDGYIYINLYSNMLLLVPLTIYLVIKDRKNKNSRFLAILVFCTVVFIETLLIGHEFGRVSMYYVSKNYFALWIILAFTNYKALVEISKSGHKNLARFFIAGYIILMIIYVKFSDIVIYETNINEDENIFSVMEIFGANKTIFLHKKSEFNQEELDIVKYAYSNLDLNSRIEIVADHKAYYWFYVLTGYIDKDDQYIKRPYYGQKLLENKYLNIIDKINNNKDELDYVIYFNKSMIYDSIENKLFEDAEIIYQNKAGGIVKYNK